MNVWKKLKQSLMILRLIYNKSTNGFKKMTKLVRQIKCYYTQVYIFSFKFKQYVNYTFKQFFN